MNKQKENIEFMIGRLTMLCFFIFILFSFSAAFSPNEDSSGRITKIEQLMEVENFAIPVDPVSFTTQASLWFLACGFLYMLFVTTALKLFL